MRRCQAAVGPVRGNHQVRWAMRRRTAEERRPVLAPVHQSANTQLPHARKVRSRRCVLVSAAALQAQREAAGRALREKVLREVDVHMPH